MEFDSREPGKALGGSLWNLSAGRPVEFVSEYLELVLHSADAISVGRPALRSREELPTVSVGDIQGSRTVCRRFEALSETAAASRGCPTRPTSGLTVSRPRRSCCCSTARASAPRAARPAPPAPSSRPTFCRPWVCRCRARKAHCDSALGWTTRRRTWTGCSRYCRRSFPVCATPPPSRLAKRKSAWPTPVNPARR